MRACDNQAKTNYNEGVFQEFHEYLQSRKKEGAAHTHSKFDFEHQPRYLFQIYQILFLFGI